MISRFDHAVIAVPDIDSAIEVYSALGFEVAAGGRHPSLGTRNAIVRFGLDYLELLTVEDADQARARGSFGAELADFLDKATGLVGFVLASAKLENGDDDGWRMRPPGWRTSASRTKDRSRWTANGRTAVSSRGGWSFRAYRRGVNRGRF